MLLLFQHKWLDPTGIVYEKLEIRLEARIYSIHTVIQTIVEWQDRIGAYLLPCYCNFYKVMKR